MVVAEKTKPSEKQDNDRDQRSDLQKRLEEAKRSIDRQPESVRVQLAEYLKHR
jgi:hypothetical protein